MSEALRVFDKFIVCLEKTPEECAASLSSLMEKAIKAYNERGPNLRHGIALDKQQIRIDVAGLESTLGVEVIPVDSRRQIGFDRLKSAISQARISESVFRDISQPTIAGGDYREATR